MAPINNTSRMRGIKTSPECLQRGAGLLPPPINALTEAVSAPSHMEKMQAGEGESFPSSHEKGAKPEFKPDPRGSWAQNFPLDHSALQRKLGF